MKTLTFSFEAKDALGYRREFTIHHFGRSTVMCDIQIHTQIANQKFTFLNTNLNIPLRRPQLDRSSIAKRTFSQGSLQIGRIKARKISQTNKI